MNIEQTRGGLNGDYEGSCISCLRGTDTGLVFVGQAEWIIAGFHVLGLPETDAVLTLSAGWGTEPGTVPGGWLTQAVRVCSDCAQAADLTVGLVAGGQPLPTYGQRTP